MSANAYDTSSNWVAGVRVTSKNQGAVGAAALKSGTGNSTLNAALLNLQDMDDVETYLAASTAHGVGYYSATRLSQLNKNDKIFAAKSIADPNSLK